MVGSAPNLVVRSHRRSRRCARTVQRAVRCRAGAPKLVCQSFDGAEVESAHQGHALLAPVDPCESEGAAAAAGALLRRVASVGPEASLSEVAEKWGHLCALAAQETEAPRPATRRVHFAKDDTPIVHEITPYSEIYGLHPREFVFGRHFRMIPAGGDFGFVDFLTACRRGRKGTAGGNRIDEDSDDSYDWDSEEEDW